MLSARNSPVPVLLLLSTTVLACLLCPCLQIAPCHAEPVVFLLTQNLLQAEQGASDLRRMAGVGGEGWTADVRVGLYTILVSRSGQHQRHSALRLAAAVLELAQLQWLLGPTQPVIP